MTIVTQFPSKRFKTLEIEGRCRPNIFWRRGLWEWWQTNDEIPFGWASTIRSVIHRVSQVNVWKSFSPLLSSLSKQSERKEKNISCGQVLISYFLICNFLKFIFSNPLGFLTLSFASYWAGNRLKRELLSNCSGPDILSMCLEMLSEWGWRCLYLTWEMLNTCSICLFW